MGEHRIGPDKVLLVILHFFNDKIIKYNYILQVIVIRKIKEGMS